MGNNNSRNEEGDVDPANTLDDFEPIDKPASPTFMSSFQKTFNPNDDLTTSGVLVDIPEEDKPVSGEKRRSKTPPSTQHHHHHDAVPISQQSDAELLQESLTKDKQERLQKLQTDQKNRRNKAIEERRKSPTTPSSSSSADVVHANPFSRFLSVFSVEPQFPNHKRRYEPSESEIGAPEEDDPKRPKLDPNATPDNPSSSLRSILLDWLDTHLPPGWPWMAAAATSTAIVAFLLTTRNTKQRQPLLLPPPSKVTTIW